jgi:hypothetical protein
MEMKFSRRVALVVVVAAGASALGTVITRADPPGYLFMDIDNNQALVVQKPRDQMTARIFKQPTKLADDLAARIADGAQPAGDGVIVVYKGQLYILPDKKVGEHMATHMVMGAAGAPNHGE